MQRWYSLFNKVSALGFIYIVVSLCIVCVIFVEGQSHRSTSDYGESDYDDKDVQFDPSPPNVLILLANSQNGSTAPLANEPNTDVVLDRSYGKVHLFCSAYYPIKWDYHGEGFPFLNVDLTRFTEDFYDPTSYAFSALLELDGLKESQTGNYTCRKWDDPSFASTFYVYVPGDRVFLAEANSTVFVDASFTEVKLPCAVSDPHANITLAKFTLKGQGESEWSPVSPSTYEFDPKTGLTFKKGTSVILLAGRYLCSVGSKSVEITVNLTSNASVVEGPSNECCDKKYLRGLGDERTSCRAFISQSCQSPNYFDPSGSPCSDWKLAQFLKNPVELCKSEIAPSNSTVGVGYFSSNETAGPRLFMFCQADPKEYTQGFKMAVEWKNGSMLFVDDERHLVPGLSEFPSGYEVHAEITDLLDPVAPSDPVLLHCYIPLKFSFKWIKILKEVPTEELIPYANAWYNPSTITTIISTTQPTNLPDLNNKNNVGRGTVDLDNNNNNELGDGGRSNNGPYRSKYNNAKTNNERQGASAAPTNLFFLCPTLLSLVVLIIVPLSART